MPVAPVTTEVGICNLALARLGQKPITDIETPTTWVEDLCALHYPMTRQSLLRSYIFNFAKKYAQLTVDGTVTPAFGYASAFALPNDFLRLLALGDSTINDDTPQHLYDVVNGYIYTDQEDETDTINISYVFDETNVVKWDALFKKLIRLELAKDMAYAFTLRSSLIKTLDDELENVRLAAAAVSGQEKPPRRIERSRWREGRRIGGILRDTTRHSI